MSRVCCATKNFGRNRRAFQGCRDGVLLFYDDFGKRLKQVAPRAGFEPATNRLTAGCSTTELPGNSAER